MATTLLQVRIDDSLKDEAARVFEGLGIDTSTAVRMFLKRAVLENGIPFRMTLPQAPYKAERGYQAMLAIGESSQRNGVSELTLDEINNVIQQVFFIGGCNGNLQGISQLVRGQRIDDVLPRLDGIRCGMKGTSCPDQLCRALEKLKNATAE